LFEEIGRLRIVAVLSCHGEQTFDLSTIARVTTIEERHGKMILSLLAAVFGCVVGPDGPSVCLDGRGRIPASSYPVLETVTYFEPGITIFRASRTSPPLKGSPEVAQFAICNGDVVRSGRVPEAKLFLQPTNRVSMPVQITHEQNDVRRMPLVPNTRLAFFRPLAGRHAHRRSRQVTVT